ncbi:MAG: DUF177 domain-containing protein [Flavobacteriales bacterium]|nr:DUF177 domain-containing protein [Flavobacteriales bacterium]
MRTLEQYTIEFAGLKNGNHHFDFELDQHFLENFPLDETVDIAMKVFVELEKSDALLNFNCSINGTTTQPCDSCGELCDISFDNEDQLLVKFSSNAEEVGSDNMVILDLNEHKIDLSQFLYELVVLSSPLKRAHEEGKCDESTISRLSSEERGTMDPRWAKLKDLEI